MATPAELDELINQHFMFEATNDVDGVVGSLDQSFTHEVFPMTRGTVTDRGEVRDFYSWLFDNVNGTGVTPLKRYYGENFLIDETVWHGDVEDGAPLGCPGMSGPVSFRMLHVFEVNEGKITKEQVWCDLAELQKQLSKK